VRASEPCRGDPASSEWLADANGRDLRHSLLRSHEEAAADALASAGRPCKHDGAAPVNQPAQAGGTVRGRRPVAVGLVLRRGRGQQLVAGSGGDKLHPVRHPAIQGDRTREDHERAPPLNLPAGLEKRALDEGCDDWHILEPRQTVSAAVGSGQRRDVVGGRRRVVVWDGVVQKAGLGRGRDAREERAHTLDLS